MSEQKVKTYQNLWNAGKALELEKSDYKRQ